MFEDKSNQSDPQNVMPGQLQQKPVEDIFAGQEKAASALSQSANVQTATAFNEQSNTPKPIDDLGGGGKSFGKNVLMIFFILVILGGLSYGGWWAYGKFIKDKINININQAPNINNILQNLNQNVSTPAASNSNVAGNKVNQPAAGPVDSDNDGLTDEDEIDLSTNIKQIDSDGDGLDDYQEVKVYQTDPLNKDSDNDSYSDGEEVKNGYNPLGAGRLP